MECIVELDTWLLLATLLYVEDIQAVESIQAEEIQGFECT
jgi:hypothetical protein